MKKGIGKTSLNRWFNLNVFGSTNVANHVAMYVGNNKIFRCWKIDQVFYDYHKYFPAIYYKEEG